MVDWQLWTAKKRFYEKTNKCTYRSVYASDSEVLETMALLVNGLRGPCLEEENEIDEGGIGRQQGGG